MSNNDVLPVTDSNEEDEANTVTMVDVLKEEEILEENADAVLGPGDDEHCTYSLGYLKRQALYSCLTCLPVEGGVRAGVCLACSYHCHSDHDLVELYTKRNFRCDCGTEVFGGKKCSLDSVKVGKNEENLYNQNFERVYCTCKRPYPDPEDESGDAMIQCIICEDWLHTRHLGTSVPKEDDYGEMICALCVDKLPFLQYYQGYSVSKITKDELNESSANISVMDNSFSNKQMDSSATEVGNPAIEENKLSIQDNKTSDNLEDIEGQPPQDKNESVSESISSDIKNDLSKDVDTPETIVQTSKEKQAVVNTDPKQDTVQENECLLKTLKKLPKVNGATFWPDNFRKLLCTCLSCLDMYKNEQVSFLIDFEDTVQFYEERGKERNMKPGHSQYERGMQALSNLDRVHQMEAILSYNDMKTHLRDYLAKFVENKKVVREEDIHEFFSGMQARKRQKLDIPYNCH